MFSFTDRIIRNSPPWFTVSFDSTSGLVKALGNSLHGKGFLGVGTIPESEVLAKIINAVPWPLKEPFM